MKKILFSRFFGYLVLIIGFSQEARAQNRVGQFIKDTTQDVILDPTTYTPMGLSWLGKKLDWDSSQIFFRNGYVETHPDLTVSGLPNDKPVSHAVGNRRIIQLSLPVLQLSVLNNVAVSIPERILIRRHPNHKRIIRSIGWVEKITIASYLGYKYSHRNFGQWQTNKNLARQLGLK